MSIPSLSKSVIPIGPSMASIPNDRPQRATASIKAADTFVSSIISMSENLTFLVCHRSLALRLIIPTIRPIGTSFR